MKAFEKSLLSKYAKYFEESKFLNKLGNIALKAGKELIYKALLLYVILLEKDVPISVKTTIVGALGYLIFPMDLVPDFTVGLGFTDDLAAIMFVLSQIEEYRTDAIETKAKELFKGIFKESYE